MGDGAPSGPLLFLSHAGADTGAARALKQRIEGAPEARKRGLKVWFDKDNLRAGESWQKQLEETIGRQATAFAVYVGSRGVINWVEAEVRLGLSRAIGGKGQHFPFIPVLAAGAVGSDALPGFARQFQAVRDVETNADEFQKLVAAVLGEAEAGSLPLEKEPFFGLKAIDETRSHLFFGRERETQELIERLSATHLLMVTGDSGSGKSSLVRAGLVPRWRGGALAELKGRRPDEEIWHVIETRPGSNPRRALGDAVFAAAKRLGASAADCGTYKEWATSDEAEKVRDGLRCGLPANCTRTLVVVDQLEELLTLAPEEHRRGYVQLLLDLATPKDEAFAVVLTMRRDYYNLCSEFPPLYDRLEADNRRARYLLERMRDDDLRRVVTEPLKLAGVASSAREALARSVLQDVGERAGDLALVQFALTATWQHRNEYDGDLLRSYTGIHRVEGALARAAENVYADKNILGGDARETEIAAVFIRLVRLGDTGGATRRIARRGEFSDARWRMLQALAEDRGNRLVLISGPERAERVEIAHEALVTQWPRFQRWLQAAAADKRVLDELIERAARWATPEGSPATRDEQEALIDKANEPVTADSKGRDQYLATGADLERFDKLEQKHKDWLSPTEVAYVTTSKDAQQREERRRIWLFRGVVAASVLFAAAAVIAWLFYLSATKQTQIAEAATRIATANEARAIANESRALTGLSRVALEDGRPNQAAQLALAAWPRDGCDQHPRFETTLQNLSRALSTGRLYSHQMQHGAPVNGAVLTKDETRILSWSYDNTVRLWDVATGQPIGPAMKHDGWVLGAVLTKDKTRILSWSKDNTVRLWDAATGQQIGPAMKHDGGVNGAVLAKDETRILSWSADHTLRLWDVATGHQIGPAMKHDGAVKGAVLAKDDTRILSWSDDNTLRLWDVATGHQIGPAMKHDGWVLGAVLTKDGTRILSWSYDNTVRLWDVATGQQIGPAMKHDGFVKGAVLTKDETRILSWSYDGTLRLWDVATGQQIGPAMKHDGGVNGAVLTKDGTRILSWSDDHTLRLWDVATGQQIGPAMKHDGVVNRAVLTKDETRILSWSYDNTLRLWDVATGQPIGPAMKHDGGVNGAVLTKDETRILSWSYDNTLRLWDVATGQQIGPAMKHDRGVNRAVLTKDETRILSWSYDNTLRLWDVATGQQIGPAMKHDGGVNGAVLTKDETRILSWSYDNTLRLWDVATGQQIGPAMKHDDTVKGAVLTKDETRILSWSDDSTLRLWDVATGQQIGPAMKHDDTVKGAVLTKDETRILSWSRDHTLRLWDVATGQQIGPANDTVYGAVLTKDETRILSWSDDKTLRLWDVTTGQQIGPAMKHDGGVNGAVLTKDETRILSWSYDKTLRLWDVATGQPIGPAMKHDGGVEGAVQTKDETRILSWSDDKTLRLWDVATGQQIGPAMKHDGGVNGAVLTKDETRILSWSYDGTLRLWDVATGQQIGPAMKHDGGVNGAVLTKDETRILSWSDDSTLRLWDAGWPKGNLLEVVCALLPIEDRDASNASKHYGVTIRDPICTPATATLVPGWSQIGRAPPY